MFEFRTELTKLYVGEYIRYLVLMYLAKTKVGNRVAEADDLVHDVYEHCLRHKHKYTHVSLQKFKAWVAMATLNKLRNMRRRIYTEHETIVVDIFDCFEYSCGADDERAFYMIMFKELKAQLRPDHLEVAYLLAQGYSHREIAQILGMNLNTVHGTVIKIRGSATKKGILENPFKV